VVQLKSMGFDLAIIPHRSVIERSFGVSCAVFRGGLVFPRARPMVFLTDVVPFRWGVHDVDRT